MAWRASDIDLAVSAPDLPEVGWAKLRDALEQALIILLIGAVRLDTLRSESLRQRVDAEGVLLYSR